MAREGLKSPALRVAARVVLVALIVAFGYNCAVRTVDVVIYRVAASQVVHHDYDIYPKVADGGFRYAPITALLFVPLAFMPTAAGAALIYLFNIGALFGMSAIVLKLFRLEQQHFGRICGLAFLAAGGYIIEEFQSGNVHFLVFSLAIVSFLLIERGQTLAPALLLALATAMKVTPFLFVLYFAWKGRWRLCIYTMVFLALMFVAPAAFVGAQENTVLLKKYAESATQRLNESRSQSLRGVLFRFLSQGTVDIGNFPALNIAALPEETVTVLWYALSAGSVVALAAVTGRRKRNSRGRTLEYALMTAAILLLSPHTLRIYFATLFFPFAVLLALIVQSPGDAKRILIRNVLAGAFIVGTLIPLVIPGRVLSRAYEALSLHFVMALGVCVAVSVLIRSEDAAVAAGPQAEVSR